jgi:hypothetical protein
LTLLGWQRRRPRLPGGARRQSARPALALAWIGGALAVLGAGLIEATLETARGEQLPVARIALSMRPAGQISPLLYGVNYVWRLVPAQMFPRFNDALRNFTHYTLARYPGGWIAERYDWESNAALGDGYRARGGGHLYRPQAAGAAPETFLSAVPQASFVTPSAQAVRDPLEGSAVVRRSTALVRRYGDRVKMWEIGNEWWLQRGAKSNPATRAQNLRAYAALVKAAAPAMKAVNPSIEIYATGDWTNPAEFAVMRRLVGSAAWSAVGGISIHGYCGPSAERRRCTSMAAEAAAIRTITGKNKIYDSEWSVAKRLTPEDYGIRNAGQTILAFQDLALAQVTAAAYWPAVRGVPAIALVSANYRSAFATGVAFGWMARFYRGELLSTSGDLPAVAAKRGDEVSVVIVTGGGGARTVQVALGGTGLSRLVSAQVMYSRDPNDRRLSRRVDLGALPVTLEGGASGKGWAQFTADPGTAGRGASWEIARLTFR